MSESIKRGPWALRFLIVDAESGVLLFLTSNDLGKVVTVEPAGIQPDKQKWLAVPVEGKRDYYKIIEDGISTNPGRRGLTRVEGSDKIILSEEPGEWRLEIYTKFGISYVYKIHPPPTGRIGVYHLLGKAHDGPEAVIQTFPVDQVPENSDPAWQFLIPG